jgi:predicted nuclease of predicted toxin-antitoxin system
VSVKFYADQNFNGSVISGLRRRGYDILTAEEDGLDDAKDADILRRATAMGRLVLTHDFDFDALRWEWLSTGTVFSTVIYQRQDTGSIAQLIRDVETVANCLLEEELVNDFIRLPL